MRRVCNSVGGTTLIALFGSRQACLHIGLNNPNMTVVDQIVQREPLTNSDVEIFVP